MDTQSRLSQALAERYRVGRELGQGGMAVVYLAEDLKHGRQVAIKVLRPEVSAALGAERFLREIEVAARLNHPNILGLHDSGEADGLLYFVMPYVEGESLRARLDRQSPLPVDEALRITREIGDALEYAHGQGLVHRDVKPENVLFQAGHALVCDFGIARATTEAQEHLTRTGIAVGTLTYMSPEQLAGEDGLDGRTDVYALGCVLHEMLAGEPPFTAPNPQAALTKKLTGEIRDLSRVRQDVPPTVQNVMRRALEAQPEARFSTAGEFSGALEVASTVAAVRREESRLRRVRTLRRMAVGAGGLVMVGAAWWVTTLVGGPSMQRIAVLPLVNQEADSAEEYYVQGLHRDLVLEMAKAGLSVINPSSVARFANTDLATWQIAQELGVDGIIQGQADIEDSRLGLDLQLVDGKTDEIVWAGTFIEPPRQVVALYHDAIRAIASRIGFRLGSEARERLVDAPDTDPQVQDALFQARFHWQKLTAEGLDLAEDYYRLALERDSTSAEAWAGLASVYLGRAQQGLISGADAQRLQEPFIERAAELDPGLAVVQTRLAGLRTWSDWDWEGGLNAFQRALEADPLDSENRAYFSQLLLYLNRDEEALAQVERAIELEPFNTLVRALYAMDLNALRRFDDAENVLLQALERDDQAPIVLSTLRTTYHLMGRYEDAIQMWRASYEALGDTAALDALNRGYAQGGYEAALTAVADLFVERSDTAYVTPWQIATLYTRAGRKEEALHYLELAFQDHDQNMPYITTDPIFDFLREEPRFQALLERLGLPGA